MELRFCAPFSFVRNTAFASCKLCIPSVIHADDMTKTFTAYHTKENITMKRNLFRDTRGLTLIELLVTIAVIAVVAAIAVPVVTNVVSNTSDRAAEQQSADIANFTSKYSQAGTWTYDPDNQTFTGYIDTNGDGQVDADEKIEELTIDTARYSLDRTDGGDGAATPIDHTEASYLYVPDDIFTVTGTSGSSNGSSNSSATSTSNIQAFVDNYNDPGTALGYENSTQTFTGYIDGNGDGVVDSDEAVDTLVIDPDVETVQIDGEDITFVIEPDYDLGLDPNQFTTEPVEEETNLTAPTQQTSVAFIDGSNYADDTSLDITVNGVIASETEAPYLTYAFQIDPAAELDYEQDRDWSDASLFLNDYPDATRTIGNLDTTQWYYIRVWIQNSQGNGPFSHLYRLNYNDASDQWLWSDLNDDSNSSFGTE